MSRIIASSVSRRMLLLNLRRTWDVLFELGHIDGYIEGSKIKMSKNNFFSYLEREAKAYEAK